MDLFLDRLCLRFLSVNREDDEEEDEEDEDKEDDDDETMEAKDNDGP